jgi:Ca2+-binding EF-hand superfamily protein
MTNAISGMGGASAYAGVQTMTGPSAMAPTREKMTRLYNQIDTSGAGSISQSQFSSAFQSLAKPASFQALGASAVFSQLGGAAGGNVSRSEFINGMSALSARLKGQGVNAA